MASKDSIRKELLSVLAHRRHHTTHEVIQIADPAISSLIKRNRTSAASLGNLDIFPLEILHLISLMLDFETLSSLAQTCLQGAAVVQSLPAYRDLVRHAPHALAALQSTRLLRCHPANTLHAALTSTQCSCCGKYGGFLFLPTCERCCYGCTLANQSLCVMPVSEARNCFGLSSSSINKLPVMLSLPAKYCIRDCASRKRRYRFVSVRAAEELAIKKNQSIDVLAERGVNRPVFRIQLSEYHLLRSLLAAPLEEAPHPELLLWQAQIDQPNDRYCMMASVLFPSLSAAHGIENGLWCLGCKKIGREWALRLFNAGMAGFLALWLDEAISLHKMVEIARSESEFFEHIKHCPGADEMVPELQEKLEQMS